MERAGKALKERTVDSKTACLVQACQRFKDHRSERVLSEVFARAEILHQHVQGIADSLTIDCLMILSLLASHFDASEGSLPSPRLFHFFDTPSAYFCEICAEIYPRYNDTATSIPRETYEINAVRFKRKVQDLLGFVEYQVAEREWSLFPSVEPLHQEMV